ncbi:S8 family serine peptidase [Streptacidiphilus sp. N1-12]|uniref:S8 family serine peptidase n=2 Tax=Streptacidiphilus alkalitolerans TaxID=3342712 RepID=A0ABV6WHV0_9ACTN
MALKRSLRTLGAVTAVGVLLLTTALTAHADAARNKQWALQAFKAQQRIWPLSTGKGVVVAVIDSPIRVTHLDLTGQLLVGKDFASSSAPAVASDGHGTMVASLIAGRGHGPNQADGIMGLAPSAKILPLTVNVKAAGIYQQISDAIRFAVDHGAGVINISLGGVGKDIAEQSAVAYAESNNVVVVAGSGNDGADAICYPAAFPGVVAVGGAAEDGSIWAESNRGPGLVLVAPSTGILGDDSGTDSQYSLGNGTSYATAYVSAAAALVRAKFPGLTAGQVINRLVKTARDPNAVAGQTTPDPHYGYGILRPDAALNTTMAAGPAAGPLPQVSDPLAGGVKGNSAAVKQGGSSGIGAGAAAVGGVVLLALVAAMAVGVSRRRRRSRA